MKNYLLAIKTICLLGVFMSASLCSTAQTSNQDGQTVNSTGGMTPEQWDAKINTNSMLKGFSNKNGKLKAANTHELDIKLTTNRLASIEEALSSTTISEAQRTQFEEFKQTLLARKLATLEEVIADRIAISSLTTAEINAEISNIETQLD
jgi:hypothetical protein